MATNPRIPDDRQLNADLRRNAPKGGFPWILIALIVAAGILAAIIIWMPRTPKPTMPTNATDVPPQPTGRQIQFTGAKLVPSPTGNEVALDAVMSNVSNTAVTGVAVTGQFIGKNGRPTQVASKVMLLDPNTGDTKDLVQEPMQPNAQKPIRIVFDNVPQDWNHTIPGLTVTAVTAVGSTGGVGAKPNVGRVAGERTGQQNGKTAEGEAHHNKPSAGQTQPPTQPRHK